MRRIRGFSRDDPALRRQWEAQCGKLRDMLTHIDPLGRSATLAELVREELAMCERLLATNPDVAPDGALCVSCGNGVYQPDAVTIAEREAGTRAADRISRLCRAPATRCGGTTVFGWYNQPAKMRNHAAAVLCRQGWMSV